MAFTEFETALIEAAMPAFMKKRRPPEKFRAKVDLAFRIVDQSVIIFSIRPSFRDRKKMAECPIAKATYVRTLKRWKVFWLCANLRWYSYEPCPLVARVEEFLVLVDEDNYSCFWG